MPKSVTSAFIHQRAKYKLAKDHHDELMKDLWPRNPVDRAPLDEDIDVVVVGGGMSGIMTAGRLIQKGITDIRLLERGGDFGGTWYWNRYPGAACDTESYIYMPLLDETGYVPTQKYAGQRSEEHTSELQSLMRISYAVFCLKKKKRKNK